MSSTIKRPQCDDEDCWYLTQDNVSPEDVKQCYDMYTMEFVMVCDKCYAGSKYDMFSCSLCAIPMNDEWIVREGKNYCPRCLEIGEIELSPDNSDDEEVECVAIDTVIARLDNDAKNCPKKWLSALDREIDNAESEFRNKKRLRIEKVCEVTQKYVPGLESKAIKEVAERMNFKRVDWNRFDSIQNADNFIEWAFLSIR